MSPPSTSIAPRQTPPARDVIPNSDSSATLQDDWHTVLTLVSPSDLSIVFQPIIDLNSGNAAAYEALTRCSVPQYASAPVLFERATLIGCAGQLGRMIRDLTFPLVPGKSVFVNVHPQELHEAWLVRPDDPIYLHDGPVFLEVTESLPLHHFDLVTNVLREIRQRGDVKLVVDDLGAGYSNLKCIADLEPNVVKLDRELISGIDRSRRQRQLVKGVVSLCRDLNAKVVAEGVETESELVALRDTGADFAQGFLLARPSYPIPAVFWPFGDQLPAKRAGG